MLRLQNRYAEFGRSDRHGRGQQGAPTPGRRIRSRDHRHQFVGGAGDRVQGRNGDVGGPGEGNPH